MAVEPFFEILPLASTRFGSNNPVPPRAWRRLMRKGPAHKIDRPGIRPGFPASSPVLRHRMSAAGHALPTRLQEKTPQRLFHSLISILRSASDRHTMDAALKPAVGCNSRGRPGTAGRAKRGAPARMILLYISRGGQDIDRVPASGVQWLSLSQPIWRQAEQRPA